MINDLLSDIYLIGMGLVLFKVPEIMKIQKINEIQKNIINKKLIIMQIMLVE